MKSTQFRQDYKLITKKLATSYGPRPGGGLGKVQLAYGQAGASSLLTTVEDLARWDQNFYDAKVGGKAVVERMLTRGKLNSGKEIPYAGGVIHGTYRGLATVQHTGSHGGYRTILLRLPAQRFCVILLANVASFNSVEMARKVADEYLADQFKPPPKTKAVKLDARTCEACVGEYLMDSGISLTISREDDGLCVRTPIAKSALVAVSSTHFVAPDSDDYLTFFKRSGSDSVKLQARVNGFEQAGQKLKRVELTKEQLAEYVGGFYSDELDAFYTVSLRGDKLVLRLRKGEVTLRPAATDQFTGEGVGAPFQSLQFTRDGGKRVDGFRVNTGRIRNLRFTKAEIKLAPPTLDRPSPQASLRACGVWVEKMGSGAMHHYQKMLAKFHAGDTV